jgi:hypothetical protein
MRSITKSLITLMVVVDVTISFVTPVLAKYDNSSVYTTIDGVKYYMDGTKLMKDGKKIVNFRDLTYKYKDTEITEDMMKTLLVTDLAHDKWNGYDIIYAVGLVFKPEQDKLSDSSQFKDQKIKIGIPYMLVMSYCVGGPTKDIEMYNDKYLLLEGSAKYDALWDAAHDVRLDESQDPTEDESYDTLYNFAARLVHPRIIMSSQYEHRAYILAQDNKSTDVPYDHIKLFTFNTDRTIDNQKVNTFIPELYMTFWWLNDIGQKYGDYEVRLDRFYIKEQKKDDIVIYNFGDDISIAIESDISIHTKPKLVKTYWQDTVNLGIDNLSNPDE